MKFKVLFKYEYMLVPFIVFTRGVGMYLLFTIPAIAVPFIYAYSAFLAIVFGSAGGLLFVAFYLLIAGTNLSFRIKMNLLSVFVFVSVTASYFLIHFMNAADDLWGYNYFLVFPGIAVISGWASLFMSRKTIRIKLCPEETQVQLLLKP